MISNNVNSVYNLTLKDKKFPPVKSDSLFSYQDEASVSSKFSNCQPSTSDNSHIHTQREKTTTPMNLNEKDRTYFSPLRKMSPIGITPLKGTNKLVNSFSGKNLLNDLTDEATQLEIKRASILFKLKEKEIKDKNLMYQTLKEKFVESKKKLLRNRESLSEIKNSNMNLKSIICGIIKHKK
jgi:hypothetical protein